VEFQFGMRISILIQSKKNMLSEELAVRFGLKTAFEDPKFEAALLRCKGARMSISCNKDA
jgi:hypothetical protein